MEAELEYKWREGQEVEAIRIVKKWRLSKRDAEEMNEGENPLYPWQVDRFNVAGDLSVRQQERAAIGKWLRDLAANASEVTRLVLSHVAATIEDGDHADKVGE
tara:strand:+ start:798 stop:1106 length:309 start_codon:yes stop_codon:yes gene_type:complete